MPAVSVGCSVTQPLPGYRNAPGPMGVEEVPLMGGYQEYPPSAESMGKRNRKHRRHPAFATCRHGLRRGFGGG